MASQFSVGQVWVAGGATHYAKSIQIAAVDGDTLTYHAKDTPNLTFTKPVTDMAAWAARVNARLAK